MFRMLPRLMILLCLLLACPARAQTTSTVAGDDDSDWDSGLDRNQVLLDDRDRVFHCDFGPDSDVDYDKWPNKWQRQTGFGFPKYNPLQIVSDSDEPDNQVMELGLDGQKAAMYSPAIEVAQQFSYVLSARCRVERKPGHNCRAWASINFRDADGKTVSVHRTPVLVNREGWFHLSTSLLVLEQPSIRQAIVGLHIEPLEETSLFGKCWFDDVSVYQLPRIVLQTGQPLNIFTDPERVKLDCQVSGARRTDAGLRMELYDERGKLLRITERSLLGDSTKKMMMLNDGTFANYPVKHLAWKLVDPTEPELPVSDLHGYYRLVIKLQDRDTRQMVRELSFVVVDPANVPEQTLFGWTLNRSIYDLEQNSFVTALRNVGVNWVKIPVWIDIENYALLERISTLLQKLNRFSIDVVGVLDEPPKAVYERFWQHEQGMAALTADLKTFQAAIEPVMTQLSLRISRWQLGGDDDTSIAEDMTRIQRMGELKSFFTKYGDESRVGLPWTWMLQRPKPEQQTWDFTSLVAFPELSASEMAQYVHQLPDVPGRENYLSLQPLPGSQYDLLTRVRDYASRFVETKRLQVERAFVPYPFDPDSGFFREGDLPTEMLCPWRTLAVELNGATYLGSIQLPGFSENHVFEKDGYATMLVWNDQPTAERLFLGERIEVMDLWGRRPAILNQGNVQEVAVDSWPLLIRKMDLSVAKVRRSIAFDRNAIDSILGARQPLKLSFENGFPRGISGLISLVNDTLFSPKYSLNFKVGRGGQFEYTIPMQINQDALCGEQLVRLDFEFHNEELNSFSAWHPLGIGLDDVEFATRSGMTDNNQFVLKITMINRSEQPVSYVAYLFVPGRKRMSIMFHNVPPGQQSKTLRVYNASDLVGQTIWLSTQDTRRNRKLNYRIEVQ